VQFPQNFRSATAIRRTRSIQAHCKIALLLTRNDRWKSQLTTTKVTPIEANNGSQLTDTIADNLLQRASAVKLLCMKRQLIVAIVMLAIGLQGSVVAFAGISPLMSTDCQTSLVSHSDASQDSCCPKDQHAMGCCLEACVGTVASAVTTTPQVLKWLGSSTLLPQFLSTRFSSRGDSPLIRPPIL